MVPYYWTKHRCERIDCRRNITSNVITMWELLIEQYFCIGHYILRSDARRTITASVIYECGLVTNARFLLQSSFCSKCCLTQYNFKSHQTVWRVDLVNYYYISHYNLRRDYWRTFTASTIAVCGLKTDSLLLRHQSSQLTEWWLMNY